MQFNNVCNMCIYSKICTLPEEDVFLKHFFIPCHNLLWLSQYGHLGMVFCKAALMHYVLHYTNELDLTHRSFMFGSCLTERQKMHMLDAKPQFDMLEICLQVSTSNKLESNDEQQP